MLFWLFTLLVLSVSAAAWWLWQQKISHTPRFNSISVTVNGQPLKLLSGETLSLRPQDKLKITNVSTSIPFNMDVRLVCQGLDVNALEYDAIKLTELLPEKNAFDRYEFPVEIKHLNRVIGRVTWIIQPYAEDWLEKANRIIDDQRRLDLLERGHALLPDDDPIRDRLLKEYMAQKKWKRALSMLKRKAQKKDDVETLSDLLACYTALDDKNGVFQVLNRLIEKRPDDLQLRERLAQILVDREEWNEAALQYEFIIEKTPPSERLALYKNLGFLYTKAGRLEKAISAYLSAANIDQKDPNLHYNLSALYERLGRQKEADFYLDNAVTLNSEDFEGRLKLAQRLADRGNLEGARKSLVKVLEIRPDSKRGLALMANILERQENNEELKHVYEKILSLEPDNEAVGYNLGVVLYETGNLKGALPYFEAYAQNHPEDITVQEILFDIYTKEKDAAKAFETAMVLIEQKPGFMEPYDFLFQYLTEKKEYDRLIAVLEKGIEKNPDEAPLNEYLAATYLKAEKTATGVHTLEKLLDQAPDRAAPLLAEYFEVLLAQKNYQAIVDLMKKAVKRDPENTIFREYLVVAYLKSGKEQLAITEMERILEQKPDDADLWLQLARLCEKKNQISKAIKAYRRVLDLSPDHPEASEAYLRLRLEGVGGD